MRSFIRLVSCLRGNHYVNCFCLLRNTYINLRLWLYNIMFPTSSDFKVTPYSRYSHYTRCIYLNTYTIYHHVSLIQIAIMLMTMSAMFIISWLPLHIFHTILSFTNWIPHDKPSTKVWFLSVLWLAMSNSFQNPAIYCFLNKKFQVCVLHF